MRRTATLPVRILASMLFSLTGLSVLTVASAVAAPPAAATLTGELEQRTFIKACGCYPWVINKNARASEVDVSAVQAAADALAGHIVKATGRWYTYRRDSQTIRYFKVVRLDPV